MTWTWGELLGHARQPRGSTTQRWRWTKMEETLHFGRKRSEPEAASCSMASDLPWPAPSRGLHRAIHIPPMPLHHKSSQSTSYEISFHSSSSYASVLSRSFNTASTSLGPLIPQTPPPFVPAPFSPTSLPTRFLPTLPGPMPIHRLHFSS